jgi:hypothetical protein
MINVESSVFDENIIKRVEERYHAKYLFEACLKNGFGGWTNQPAAIFYTEEPHPQGSNYFGLYMYHGLGTVDGVAPYPMITNGVSATQGIYNAVRADDGEIIYSRYRHDYRASKDGSVNVDGGRDYFKTTAPQDRWVQFVISGDQLKLV